MSTNKSSEDSISMLDTVLISHVQNYGSLWHKNANKYTELEQMMWEGIADEMGVQSKSF